VGRGASATHEEHRVGDLVLAHAAAEDDHARLLALDRQVVEAADVADDIDRERRLGLVCGRAGRRVVVSGALEAVQREKIRAGRTGVEVHHVAERAVCQGRAEDRDLVLRAGATSVSSEFGRADALELDEERGRTLWHQ